MKKRRKINRSNVVLTGVIGGTLGAAAALIPLLDRQVETETIMVSNFFVTNTGFNSSTVSFELDLTNISKKAKNYIEEKNNKNEPLNVNILENATQKIISTSKAFFDSEDNKYSLEVDELESGKIYSVQVVDIDNERINFNFGTNAPFIVTKSQVVEFLYQIDKRNAEIQINLSDEQRLYAGKKAIVSYHKLNDTEIKTFETEVKEKILDESNDSVLVYLKDKVTDLERNTTYVISKVEIENEAIEFAKNVQNNFKTLAPYTEISEIKMKENTKSRVIFDLVFDGKDKDIENKVVNIEYYKFNEYANEASETITNYKVSETQTIVKQTIQEEDKEVEKFLIKDVVFDDLEPGSQYKIALVSAADLVTPENDIIVERNRQNSVGLWTMPVVSKIENDTSQEKTSFTTIVFKDDSFVLNGKKAIITIHKKDDKANPPTSQKTVSAKIIGNTVRFNILELDSLTTYKIDEIKVEKLEENKAETIIECDSSVLEVSKEFTTIVSPIQIDSVAISEETETSAKVIVFFNEESAFIEGEKTQLVLSYPGAKSEGTPFPKDLKASNVSISKDNSTGKYKAEFEVTDLKAGINYYIKDVKIDNSDFENVNGKGIEFKTFFDSSIEGADRKFFTKPAIDKISYVSEGANVVLNFEFINSYPTNETINSEVKTFEGKRAKVKFALLSEKDDQSKHKEFETSIIKNNFATLDLSVETLKKKKVDPLIAERDYIIISIEIDGYNTSSSNSNLVDKSVEIQEIKEADKMFSTSVASATIVDVQNTNIQKHSSTVKFIFSPESSFMEGKTVKLDYRLIGDLAEFEPVEGVVQKEVLSTGESQYYLNYEVKGLKVGETDINSAKLKIGSKFVIENLRIMSPADNPNRINPTILFDTNLADDKKVFVTSNGIDKIEIKNDIETKAVITVYLSDTDGEYSLNKDNQLKLTLVNAQDGTTFLEPMVKFVNNIAVFSEIKNLIKNKEYKISQIQLITGTNETIIKNLDFSDEIAELSKSDKIIKNNKKFTASYQSATIESINQLVDNNTTIQGTKLEVKFKDTDAFMWDLSFPLKMKYRLRGSDASLAPLETTSISNYDSTTKKLTFDLTNQLENGSIYNIVGFVSEKDGKEIEIKFDHLDQEQKQFWTKPTVSKIDINKNEEAKAKIYVSFNDSKRYINKRELKITLKHNDGTTAGEFVGTATSESGLYVFDLNNLPKNKKLKVEKIEIVKVENSNTTYEEIPFSTNEEQLEKLNESKVFVVNATSITIKQVEASSITKNSATVTLTIDDKDEFANGRTIILLYRGQKSSDILKTSDTSITINNKTATFNLTNLDAGVKYEIIGFEVVKENDVLYKYVFDESENSQAKLTNRLFRTTNTVNKFDFVPLSETSGKLVVTLNDDARTKNDFNANVKYYKNSENGTKLIATTTKIKNGRAIFELTNLTKGVPYTIESFLIGNTAEEIIDQNTTTNLEFDNSTVLNTNIFELTPQSVQISSLSSTTTETTGILTVKLAASDIFALNRNVVVTLRKQGTTTKKELSGTFVEDGTGGLKVELNVDNLDAGTIYIVSKIKIDGIQTTTYASTIEEKHKQVVTKPNITKLDFSIIDEKNYKATLVLRDPLTGSSDDRTFDGKKIKVTYNIENDTNTLLTIEGNVSQSIIEVNLSNLTKGKVYEISKVEYENSSGTWEPISFNSNLVPEEKRKLTVTPRTANVVNIQLVRLEQTSATVRIEFDKSEDGFMQFLNKPLSLIYKNSENPTNSDPISSVGAAENVGNDKIGYTFELDNLGHGNSIRLIKISTIDDVTINFADSVTERSKRIDTIGSVRGITNNSLEEEKEWNLRINLKDLNKILDTRKLMVVYNKIEPAGDSTEYSSETTINNEDNGVVNESSANIKLINLEKFAKYKIKKVQLLNVQGQPTDLVFETTSVSEDDKTFQVFPRTAKIKDITDKTTTLTSASFKMVFDEEDSNYLSQYNNIVLNYRKKSGSLDLLQKKPEANSVTKEGNNVVALFSFDPLEEGSYEMISVIFEGDSPISKGHANNPKNVKINFAENMIRDKKIFQTTTDVDSFVSYPEDTRADVVVKINDSTSRFIGQTLELTYYEDVETNLKTPITAVLGSSSDEGKSEAKFTLNGLLKEHTYHIKSVKFVSESGNLPLNATVTEAMKKFQTVGNTATVSSIEGNDGVLDYNNLNLVFKFNKIDAFLKGSTFVEPNTTVKSLYLNIQSIETGQPTQIGPVNVEADGEGAKVTFNLTNRVLQPGEKYNIVSLSNIDKNAANRTGEIFIEFDSSLTSEQKTFKTRSILGRVDKNLNRETQAELTIQVNNNWNSTLFGPGKKGKLVYGLVSELGNNGVGEIKQEFDYNKKDSINLTLTNLQKGAEYKILRVEFNDGANIFNFEGNANTSDDNLKFTTIMRSADVTIEANDDKLEGQGTFNLRFGDFDNYINDGYKVNIQYQNTSKTEKAKWFSSAQLITNKAATFDITDLTAGETYQIVDVRLEKNDQVQPIRIVYSNNTNNSELIKTLSNIQEIKTSLTTEEEAQIKVIFNNENEDITNGAQLTLELELLDSSVPGATLTRASNATIQKDNGQWVATFDFNNNNKLHKGLKYRIKQILNGNSPILFHETLKNPDVDSRNFVVLAQTTKIVGISLDVPTGGSARDRELKMVFDGNDIFLNNPSNVQQASITIGKINAPDEKFSTELINIVRDTTTGNPTISTLLSDLDGGTGYEILSVTITSGVNVSFDSTLTTQDAARNNKKDTQFYTFPEVKTITLESITENSATLKFKFIDEENKLSNTALANGTIPLPKVTYVKNPGEQNEAVVGNEVSLTDWDSTEKTGKLVISNTLSKNTLYKIKDNIFYPGNLPVERMVWDKNLLDGGELALSKEFTTKAETTTVRWDTDGQNWKTNGTGVENSKLKLKFSDNEDFKFMKGRKIALEYQKWENRALSGNPVNYPTNATVQDDGTLVFDVEGLEDGSQYKIINLTDLSAASERIAISLDNSVDMIFETLVKEPTINSIYTYKAEKVGTNEIYKYKVKFDVLFNDPKEAIKWNDVTNWNISALVKAGNLVLNEENLDNTRFIEKMEITKNINNINYKGIQFAIELNNIKDYMGRDFVFTISNLKYSQLINKSDEVIVPNYTIQESGAEIKTKLTTKILVEEVFSANTYNHRSFGFGFRIYDPENILRVNNRIDSTPSVNASIITSQQYHYYATPNYKKLYDFRLSFKYRNAFGTNNTWTTNNDGSTITGTFLDTTFTKTNSGFLLKQDSKGNESWIDAAVEIKDNMYSVSVYNDPEQGYKQVYTYFRVQPDAGNYVSWLSNWESTYQGKQIKLDKDSIRVLGSNIVNGMISNDIENGLTIIREDLEENILYSFPNKTYWKGVRGINADTTFSYNTHPLNLWDSRETNKIEKVSGVNNVTYDSNAQEIKVSISKSEAIATGTTFTGWPGYKGYAVFRDKQGNLYFLGNDSGEPIDLTINDVNDPHYTFKVNGTNVLANEQIPSQTDIYFVGVWTKVVNEGVNEIAPISVRADALVDVYKKITIQ